jgi:predicted GNAT family acetyltransferase
MIRALLLLLLALPFSGPAAQASSLADSTAICDYDASAIVHATASAECDYDPAARLANAATLRHHSLANIATAFQASDGLIYGYVRGPPLAEFAALVAPGSAIARDGLGNQLLLPAEIRKMPTAVVPDGYSTAHRVIRGGEIIEVSGNQSTFAQGFISYRSVGDGTIKIERSSLSHHYQGQGVGRALYHEILRRTPNTKRIVGELELDNLESFMRAGGDPNAIHRSKVLSDLGGWTHRDLPNRTGSRPVVESVLQ